MTDRHRRIALVIAPVGIVVCLTALMQFIVMWAMNGLSWSEGMRAQDHYQTVGHFFSRGFVVGFFFSFFLLVLSVAVSSWWEDRRRQAVS